MRYFDYENVAQEAGISPEQLARLVKAFADEGPHDPMLAELHTLRACMAIKQGHLTVEEALAEGHSLAA